MIALYVCVYLLRAGEHFLNAKHWVFLITNNRLTNKKKKETNTTQIHLLLITVIEVAEPIRLPSDFSQTICNC